MLPIDKFVGGIIHETEIAERGWDYAMTVAALKQLALVVTCDSVIAHLDASLGIATWVALPVASEESLPLPDAKSKSMPCLTSAMPGKPLESTPGRVSRDTMPPVTTFSPGVNDDGDLHHDHALHGAGDQDRPGHLRAGGGVQGRSQEDGRQGDGACTGRWGRSTA